MFTRLVTALLACSCCALSTTTAGQQVEMTTSKLSFHDDSQDFYLYQNFLADKPENRIAINHLGAQYELVDDQWIVSAVLEDYPAQRAGLRRGDRLLEVDGKPFHPLHSFNEKNDDEKRFAAQSRARILQFQRNDQKMNAEIKPVFENLYDSARTATDNSITEFASGNKLIGYVHVWSLSNSSNDLVYWRRLMSRLSRCDGLILDLRGSFGYISTAHLDEFFPVRSSYPQMSSDQLLSDALLDSARNPDQRYYDRPVVVIQDESTRGGMELFAHQLSKLQRIISVGVESAGLLAVPDHFSYPDDSSIDYLLDTTMTIDGKAIEGIGFTPEQRMAYPVSESAASDPQLSAANTTLMEII